MAERRSAFIGLGSNLGVRRRWIRRGLNSLATHPCFELVGVSSVWETMPEGPPQPNYFNAVAEVTTELPPCDIVSALLVTESGLGRLRNRRTQARRIDLDLLLCGDSVVDSPGCVVPHPRMHTRPFVLAPLSELAPGLLHPRIGRTISALREEVGNDGLIRREAAPRYHLPGD